MEDTSALGADAYTVWGFKSLCGYQISSIILAQATGSHYERLMKRIKILFRKNLKMSEGKIAAQSVHAALGLAHLTPKAANPMTSVVVLGVSDSKFEEKKTKMNQPLGKEFDLTQPYYLVSDAGFTEVPPGTETCLAFLEDDIR